VTRSTAALLLLLFSLPEPAGAIAEPLWRIVRSPNFIVLGDAGEQPLQDVAMRLEQFRAALGRVLPGIRLATPVPTVFIVFGSSQSSEPFGPRRDGKPVQAAGFFQAGLDVNYITLTLGTGSDGLRVAFHEYSHLILHNWMAAVPAWLDEGLAEYYSTFQLASGGTSAAIGLAIPHHVGLLRERFMPLRDLLAIDRRSPVYYEGDQRTLFYAQSWALTHFLLMETPRGDARIARYLALVAGGESIDRAVQQAFQMPLSALERLLRDYVNRSAYRSAEYTFRSRVEAGPGSVRALSAAETEAWLGDLLLHMNRPDEAGPRLERALELDPDLARAHLSVGMLNLGRRRPDEAWPHLRRAVALDPANFFAQYSYALALLSFRTGETPLTIDVEPMSAARAALTAAITLSPESTDALALLGYASLRDDAHLDEGRAALTRAVKLAPGRSGYALLLAEICIRQKDYAKARSLLTILAAVSDERGTSARARSMLEMLDALQRGR
jgi:tetratricopeptide (TPR) repeat protein